MKKPLFRKKTERMIIIGVLGTKSGCGVTHFIWSAANYLSNVRRKRVAVCNLTDNRNYGQARVILGDKDFTDEFIYGNITFLVQAEEVELAAMSQQYDYVFLDMGCDMGLADVFFLRCDRCFIIGDLSLWHCAGSAESAIYARERWGKKPAVLASFCTKAGLRYYAAVTGEKVLVIPFEQNPFCLHHDMLVFMEGIWKGE